MCRQAGRLVVVVVVVAVVVVAVVAAAAAAAAAASWGRQQRVVAATAGLPLRWPAAAAGLCGTAVPPLLACRRLPAACLPLACRWPAAGLPPAAAGMYVCVKLPTEPAVHSVLYPASDRRGLVLLRFTCCDLGGHMSGPVATLLSRFADFCGSRSELGIRVLL